MHTLAKIVVCFFLSLLLIALGTGITIATMFLFEHFFLACVFVIGFLFVFAFVWEGMD